MMHCYETTNGSTQKLIISEHIPAYNGAKFIFFIEMSDLC